MPGGDRPLVQWMLVVSAIVVVVLAVLLMSRGRQRLATITRLHQTVGELQAQQEELDRQLARERSAREAFQIGLDRKRAAAAVTVVALEPGFDPHAPLQQVRVTGLSRLAVALPLAAAHERYRVVLRSFTTGEELWAHARLRAEPDHRQLLVPLPVELLEPGSYELVLSGSEPTGERPDAGVFVFEVVR